MPGDYSRKLFDAKKHYSAVLEQQGRVQVDADWNEQVDIQQHRISIETIDVIGSTGIPKTGGIAGFAILPFSDGSDFIITAGRIYVDGLLFELEDDASYLHQPYYINPDISNFNSPSSPIGSPASPIAAYLKDGNYIVYFKGWQREINFHDDPNIQEVALGEADTTTRLQNAWQVKLLNVNNTLPECTTDFIEWDSLIQASSGKLSAQSIQNDTDETPCNLPPASGYSGLENQLYRVQILKSGDKNTATFIWSRNNASVETVITNVSGSVLSVGEIGKDDVLGFATGQWVEIVESEPTIQNSTLVQIDTIDEANLKITLKTSVFSYENKVGLKLRKWDVSGSGMDSGISITNGWMNIESGIQVQFSDGTYNQGDYWLIPARTATANIEWPYTTPQSPLGTQNHYCKLGLLTALNGVVQFIDCRPNFPSLSTICAEDICFDNSNCDLSGASTVQEALNILCERSGGGSCTIVVKPGPGWESALDILDDNMDAQICFEVGDYPLTSQVVLKNKGNLKLEGCGKATRIISSNAEAAIVFDHCKSIIIRDLYAEGGTVSANQPLLKYHLNGVFSLVSCASADISHLTVQSGFSDTRNCTCITITNDVAAPNPVRISDCDLLVADKQQGILVTNTSNCWIERNTIKVYTSNASGFRYPAGLRYLLNSNLQGGAIVAGNATTAQNNVTITSGNFTVNFKSDQSLKDQWKTVMSALYTTPATSLKMLQFRVQEAANKIVDDQRLQSQFNNFGALIKNISVVGKSVGSQGITIGGQIVQNAHINNNNISDVLQGIHVGVSHRTNVRQPDSINDLSIQNNSISISLPVTVGKQDRHGIFVGNCGNLLIENNKIVLQRINDTKSTVLIDGIRVWGSRGNRLIIAQNFLISADGLAQNSFSTGINVQPITTKPVAALWVAMYNVIQAKILGLSTVLLNQNNVITFS